MFNKFKSALYNVVGSFDNSNDGANSSGFSPLPLDPNGVSFSRQNSKNLKYPYQRPNFLQLNSEEEILVTADHAIRPIICPRNISNLPWHTGFAETINAGKTKKNEDQASVFTGYLSKSIPSWTGPSLTENGLTNNDEEPHDSDAKNIKSFETVPINETLNAAGTSTSHQPRTSVDKVNAPNVNIDSTGQLNVSLPYYYFAVFDGHAGWGAAVHAAIELHDIIHEKLTENLELILPEVITPDLGEKSQGPFWIVDAVSPESAIIGALEQSFWQMDQRIAQDRLKYQLSGGCTACVGLFILGKLFVSNAGDSRATISLSGTAHGMSNDFTPETESHRIRSVAAMQPELLGGEFTHIQFLQRPFKRDIGKKTLYRDHYMNGWGYKTVTADDLKYPLLSGDGKRSRVLATIGVTRGFGDHDLKALHCSLPIKPFLSPVPEILVYDLSVDLTEDDCLLLGTDGLWDITSNDKATAAVNDSLKHFPSSDPLRYMYRYTSAAQELVMLARGKLKQYNWRTSDDKHATIDDISVFVIPLLQYKLEWQQWKIAYETLLDTTIPQTMSTVVPCKSIEMKTLDLADDVLVTEKIDDSQVSETGEEIVNGNFEKV